MEPGHASLAPPTPFVNLTTVFPPAGMRGVEQPAISTKEIVIIVFMFCLWAYSLYLTYRCETFLAADATRRAWYKLLYSDGDERTNMWQTILDVVRKRRKSSQQKGGLETGLVPAEVTQYSPNVNGANVPRRGRRHCRRRRSPAGPEDLRLVGHPKAAARRHATSRDPWLPTSLLAWLPPARCDCLPPASLARSQLTNFAGRPDLACSRDWLWKVVE
jgi:hypothetical protein